MPVAVAGGAGNPMRAAASSSSGFPDGTNRPHMVSSNVMAYTDAAGAAQTVTLTAKPASGSTFGVDKTTGLPNNGAFYDPRGWVDVTVANTLIDGYDFNGLAFGNIKASGAVISRIWFHGIDGEDSWAVWTHNDAAHSGLLIADCLVQGTSSTITGPDGLLKMDGQITNVYVERCHSFNCSSFVQFSNILGDGTPSNNHIIDCYMEANSDPSNLGLHLEQVNVSSGTGGLTISGNATDGPTGQTASYYICHDAGDVGNIVINNNLLGGKPQNTIYAGDTGAAGGVLTGGMVVTNNKFQNTGGQNPGGLVIDPTPPDSRITASGNVYYPSLTPVPGL